MVLLLISGRPGAGKTAFCRWLQDTRNYVHVETDVQNEWGSRLAVQSAIQAQATKEFALNLGDDVVVEWGFPPVYLYSVRLLRFVGFDAWWFDADEATATPTSCSSWAASPRSRQSRHRRLQTATAYGMDQSFEAALLRINVFEALSELGSIDSAARVIDAVSQGMVNLSSRLDYHARATLEMLRGNLDAAEQRWVELRGLPPRSLVNQVEDASPEVETQLWRGASGAAFEQAHHLLVRSVAADQGSLSGPLLTYAGLS